MQEASVDPCLSQDKFKEVRRYCKVWTRPAGWGWWDLMTGMIRSTVLNWGKSPPDGDNMGLAFNLSLCTLMWFQSCHSHTNPKGQENSKTASSSYFCTFCIFFLWFATSEPSESLNSNLNAAWFCGFKHCLLFYLIMWNYNLCIKNIDTFGNISLIQ